MKSIKISLFFIQLCLVLFSCSGGASEKTVTNCKLTQLNTSSDYCILQWDGLYLGSKYEVFSYLKKVNGKMQLKKISGLYGNSSTDTFRIAKRSDINKGFIVASEISSDSYSLGSDLTTLSSDTSYVGNITKSGGVASWKSFPNARYYLVCTYNYGSNSMTTSRPTSSIVRQVSGTSFDYVNKLTQQQRSSNPFYIWAYNGSYYFNISQETYFF